MNSYYLNRITNNSNRVETAMRVAIYSIWQIIKLFCQPEYIFLLNNYNSLPCHSICCFLVSGDHLVQMWKYSKLPVIQYWDIWHSHPTSKNCKEDFPFLWCYSKPNFIFAYVHLPHSSSSSCHYEHYSLSFRTDAIRVETSWICNCSTAYVSKIFNLSICSDT